MVYQLGQDVIVDQGSVITNYYVISRREERWSYLLRDQWVNFTVAQGTCPPRASEILIEAPADPTKGLSLHDKLRVEQQREKDLAGYRALRKSYEERYRAKDPLVQHRRSPLGVQAARRSLAS